MYADTDDKSDKAVKAGCCSVEVFNLRLALLGSALVLCIWGLTCGFCGRTGDSCYSTEGHMTHKTAPRAPVCESGTWGGSKDTTPGLKDRRREAREGREGREHRALATVSEQFTRTAIGRPSHVHMWSTWGNTIRAANKRVSHNRTSSHSFKFKRGSLFDRLYDWFGCQFVFHCSFRCSKHMQHFTLAPVSC